MARIVVALAAGAAGFSACDASRHAPMPTPEIVAALLGETVAVRLEWASWSEQKEIDLTPAQRTRFLDWLGRVAAARRPHVPCACTGAASLRLAQRRGEPLQLVIDPTSVCLYRPGSAGVPPQLEMADGERSEIRELFREVTQTAAADSRW